MRVTLIDHQAVQSNVWRKERIHSWQKGRQGGCAQQPAHLKGLVISRTTRCSTTCCPTLRRPMICPTSRRKNRLTACLTSRPDGGRCYQGKKLAWWSCPTKLWHSTRPSTGHNLPAARRGFTRNVRVPCGANTLGRVIAARSRPHGFTARRWVRVPRLVGPQLDPDELAAAPAAPRQPADPRAGHRGHGGAGSGAPTHRGPALHAPPSAARRRRHRRRRPGRRDPRHHLTLAGRRGRRPKHGEHGQLDRQFGTRDGAGRQLNSAERPECGLGEFGG